MATADSHQVWSRSRSPLLPSSQASAPSSPTTSQSDDESAPSLAHLLRKAPAPWYHAVTAGHSQPSENNTNTDLSSFQLNENNEFTDRSSVAYSMSYQNTSPPSLVPEHHSRPGDRASPDSERLQNASLPLPGSWSNDADQTFSPDESPEQSPTQVPGRTRTLRRTPRSRRITSPVLVEDIKPPHTPSEDGRSTVVSTANSWKRKGYPLHPPLNDSTMPHPPPPPYQQDSAPLAAPSNEPSNADARRDVPTEDHSWHRQLDYPRQASTSSSHTGSATSDASSVTAAEPNDHHEDVSAAPLLKKAIRRPTYPLQSPASVANLRRSPTPPHSASEEEQVLPKKASQQTERKISQSPAPANAPATTDVTTASNAPSMVPKRKMLRRRAYPLQSPASVADLTRDITPPPSPHSEEDSDSTLQDSPPSPPLQKFRRQRYPLQRPTRVPAAPEKILKPIPESLAGFVSERLTPPPAEPAPSADHDSNRQAYPIQPQITAPAPASPQAVEVPALKPPAETESYGSAQKSTQPKQQAGLSAPLVKSSRRQKYPLQSPASHANLAEKATSSSPASDLAVQSDTAKHMSVADVPNESERTASKPEATPNSGYPIQDVPAINVDPPEHDELLRKNSREHELAGKVIKKWRREMYPLQSPSGIQPFERPVTPQPTTDEAWKSAPPKKYHLPKNIRAVKDSEDGSIKGRTIVVCLDGTGDKFDNDNSNIVHIVSALKKDDPQQVTYYQAGIGTYGDQGLTSGFAAAADMAVGSGLGLHVRDAYHFLMHTYKEGDKICIFGFSRGAYTARCLAGMIHKVGLLPPRNLQQIYFAYQFYTDTSKEGWIQSDLFKKTFSIDVNIYLLGCFDSVASVGFIPRQLPLSSTPTNKAVYFRHAMALDERRAKFKICRHQKAGWADEVKPDDKAEALFESVTEKAHEMLPNFTTQNDVPPGFHKPQRFGTEYHPNVTDEEYEELKGQGPAFETDVHEVWFAGAHADVGGGAVPNDERHKLAQIPLRWMIRQAFECNTGIIFKTKVLAEFGLDVHTLWPKYERLAAPLHAPPPSILEKYHTSLPPRHIRRDKLRPINKEVNGEQCYDLVDMKDEDWTPELVEDFYDAMSPLNDQLIQAPTWWILEFIPVEYKVPLAPGEVQLRTGMNWGQYRGVEDLEPNLHWTVRHRMQNTNYKILARTAKNTNWRVVV